MPTINPWVILGVLATAIGLLFGGYAWGNHASNTYWLGKIEKDKRQAIEQAINIERTNQGKANEIMRQQAAEQAAINNRLRTDLASLRSRSERPAAMPESARPACTGANGAELSRSDASFLVGEAARADEVRAGLAACYQVIDAVRQGNQN